MNEEDGGECPLTHCLGCLSLFYQFLTTDQNDKQVQVRWREGRGEMEGSRKEMGGDVMRMGVMGGVGDGRGGRRKV